MTQRELDLEKWIDAQNKEIAALKSACLSAVEAIDDEKTLQAGRGESVACSLGMAQSMMMRLVKPTPHTTPQEETK